MKAGLAAARTTVFNRWKKEYTDWNDSKQIPDPPSILATRFTQLIRKLGPIIGSELKTQIAIKGAENDLPKTLECIYLVLSEAEALDITDSEEHGSSLLGGASGAGDANKTRTNVSKDYDKSVGPCLNHTKPGCDGDHWMRDCPLGDVTADW